MTPKLTHNIFLFGGLRQFSKDNPITLTAIAGDKVDDIKNRWCLYCTQTIPGFDGEELIKTAVLANEERIFSGDEIIKPNQNLALLPPVCGG